MLDKYNRSPAEIDADRVMEWIEDMVEDNVFYGCGTPIYQQTILSHLYTLHQLRDRALLVALTILARNKVHHQLWTADEYMTVCTQMQAWEHT